MDPWSRGGLLTHHSGGRHGDEEGHRWWFPSLTGCREELLDPPDLGSMMAAAYSTFRGWWLSLGFFSMKWIYRQRGDVRGRTRGPHQGLARLGVGPRHPMVCPPPGPPLSLFWTPSSCHKIGTSAFFSSNSKNISCITFLKYKNSRK
jgi:hypothetical protein